HETAEVLAGAFAGHLQYLLIDRRRDLWGRFDPSTQNIESHDREQPGDEDLANFAVVHVLAHGGRVDLVEAAELPEHGPLAAIYWLPIGERSGKHAIAEPAHP